MIKLMKTLKKAWFCTIISAMFVITLSLGIVFGLRNDPISELNDTEIISPDENIDTLASTVTLPTGSTFNSYVSSINSNPSQVLFMKYTVDSDGNECISFNSAFYNYKIIGTDVYYKGKLASKWNKKLSDAVVKTYNGISYAKSKTVFGSGCVFIVAPQGCTFLANSNCSSMFEGFSSLKNFTNLENVDFSSTTSMSSMFSGCSSMETCPSISATSVRDVSSMFEGCTALTSVSSLSLGSSVTDRSCMFKNCKNLIYSISSLGNSVDKSSMFEGCSTNSGSISVDMKSVTLSNATYLKDMFKNCGVATIDLTGSTLTSSITDLSYFVSGYKGLTLIMENTVASGIKIDSSTFREENLLKLNLKGATINSISGFASMFKGCNSLTYLDLRLASPTIKTATASCADFSYMFSGCSSLSTLYGLDSITASSVSPSSTINLSYMFYNCSSLNGITFSSSFAPNVGAMEYMFNGCSSVSSLDLSKFKTSAVTSMSHVFYNCGYSKTGFTLTYSKTNFTTANVTDMQYMFAGCRYLTSLDLSNFETSKVTNMQYMFCDCKSLTSLDLSNFVTSSVTNMAGMFMGCAGFKTVGTSGENLLNISNFDTSKVTTMSNMFYNCNSLENITFSSNFVTSSVTNMGSMFSGCSGLTSLTLSNFDVKDETDVASMFNGCSKLEKIYANPNKWVKTNGSTSTPVFTGCTELSGVFTTYSADKVYANYAVIDMYDGHTPGYLTPTEKVNIDLPTTNNVGVIYNGEDQALKPGNWGDIEGVCNLNSSRKDAGTYTDLKVSLKNTDYYQWAGGSNGEKTFTATIDKMPITVKALESGYTVAYGVATPSITTFSVVSGTYYNVDNFGNASYIITDGDGAEISLGATTAPGVYNIELTGGFYNKNYIITYDSTKSTIEILKINIEDVDIVLTPTILPYDGKEQKPIINITYEAMSFTETADYTLTFDNNINVGTASVTITGKTFTGSITKYYTIIESWMSEADTNEWNGSGTETDPYQIATAQQLAKLAVDVNSQTTKPTVYKYYVLTNNINLSDKEWIPIGSELTNKYFYGSFDGNGYAITGMEIQISTYEDHYFGLFGCVKNSSINEVTLSNVKISMNQVNTDEIYVGCVAAKTENTDITKIFTNGSVNVVGNGSNTNYVCIGGIVGDATNTTKKIGSCYNEANITTSIVKGFIGGIAGSASGEISECMNFGNITAGTLTSDSRVGGICANVSGNKINNCASIGNITASSGATTYAIANVNCATYYANTNGIKVYQGTFDPNVWFVASGINSGLPMLKSIYWIGAGYTNTSAEITSALTNKGYVVA